MENYSIQHWGSFSNLTEKAFLKDALGLTGMEVSLNKAARGQGVPYTHVHRQNEEVYIVIKGSGIFFIDGQELPIQEGSAIRVAPQGERAWKAGDEDLYILCVQAKQGSLECATKKDGAYGTKKASWMQ